MKVRQQRQSWDQVPWQLSGAIKAGSSWVITFWRVQVCCWLQPHPPALLSILWVTCRVWHRQRGSKTPRLRWEAKGKAVISTVFKISISLGRRRNLIMEWETHHLSQGAVPTQGGVHQGCIKSSPSHRWKEWRQLPSFSRSSLGQEPESISWRGKLRTWKRVMRGFSKFSKERWNRLDFNYTN